MIEWLQLFTAIAVGGLVLWLRSYVGEKAKNQATKEDIAALAREVESIRASIATGEHIRRVRYEDERELLRTLLEHASKLKDATMALRPLMASGPRAGETPADHKKRICQPAENEGLELKAFLESKGPFISKDATDAASSLITESRAETAAYWIAEQEWGEEHWRAADAKRKDVLAAFEAVSRVVRDRVERWEHSQRTGEP